MPTSAAGVGLCASPGWAARFAPAPERLDDCQALAAAQAPATQHLPAPRRAHSLEKAVLALAGDSLRLPGALGHRILASSCLLRPNYSFRPNGVSKQKRPTGAPAGFLHRAANYRVRRAGSAQPVQYPRWITLDRWAPAAPPRRGASPARGPASLGAPQRMAGAAGSALPVRRSTVPIRRPRFAPTPPARGPRARLDALMRDLGAKPDAEPADAGGPTDDAPADAPRSARARQADRAAPTTPKVE